MSFQADLLTYLGARSAITALVSTRIYARKAPQSAGTAARITFNRISRLNVMSLTGESGLTHERYQFTVASQLEATTQAIIEALRDALDGFRGTMASTDVQAVFEEGVRDLPAEPDAADSNAAWYVTAADFRFSHAQTVASFA